MIEEAKKEEKSRNTRKEKRDEESKGKEATKGREKSGRFTQFFRVCQFAFSVSSAYYCRSTRQPTDQTALTRQNGTPNKTGRVGMSEETRSKRERKTERTQGVPIQ